jgi:hypothetical protein
MSDPVTPQPVRHNLPGFATIAIQQTLEKPLCCSPITSSLQEDIHHFAILINCTP